MARSAIPEATERWLEGTQNTPRRTISRKIGHCLRPAVSGWDLHPPRKSFHNSGGHPRPIRFRRSLASSSGCRSSGLLADRKRTAPYAGRRRSAHHRFAGARVPLEAVTSGRTRRKWEAKGLARVHYDARRAKERGEFVIDDCEIRHRSDVTANLRTHRRSTSSPAKAPNRANHEGHETWEAWAWNPVTRPSKRAPLRNSCASYLMQGSPREF